MKIAISGKGGSGKTSLTVFLSSYLAKTGKNVLLIDADTATSLGSALGIRPEEEPVPLSKMDELIEERVGSNILSLNPNVADLPERLAIKLPKLNPDDENEGVRKLLIMGGLSSAEGGCACRQNALLKALLAHILTNENDYVIVDMEAGVEHLGRGTVKDVEALIIVSEPSMRGLKTASEIHKLAIELGLKKQLLLINKASRTLPIAESGYDLPEQTVYLPRLESLEAREFESGSVLGLSEESEIDRVMDLALKALGAS